MATNNPRGDQVPSLEIRKEEVHAPPWYTWHPADIECKEIAEEFNYNIGCAIKYLWRHRHKGDDPIPDLMKAGEYIQNEIRRIIKRRFRDQDLRL